MSKVIVVALLIALVVTPLSILGQTPAPQQGEEKVVSGTTEVIFDAVVKDKKGRPVKDLQAADFQITEDGVPQEVKSFRLVAGEAQDTTGPNSADKSAGGGPKGKQRVLEAFTAGRIGTVALVFDRLTPDARNRAHDAATSYVGNGLGPSDFIGVFGIDQTLSVIQTFTNDDKLIKAAIDKAAVTVSTTPSTDRSQITDLMQRGVSLTAQANAAEAAAASSQNIGNLATIEMNKVFNDVSLRAAEGFERMEQTEQGRATTEGLLAIIAAMGNLPGRKALLFFSEGVSIPTAVAANFRTVISNANRANVAIYAVDAAGLRATSADIETGKQMTALGQQRINQAGSSNDAFSSMMRDSEKNEKLVQHNPEGVLGQLANETGGLLVSGTNNPGARLRQVNDDLHSYYVLTYTPKNSDYDGKFRQISVKVKRSGIDVQARKGYYAVSARYDTPVMGFQAPALAIINGNKSQANAFESRTGAFSFPETANPGLVPILVEIPGGNINFVNDTEKKTYKADFAVVAVVKDEFGHPVRKVSSRYLLTGALDQLDSAKRGAILFYRETTLEPGKYNIEAIVYDATNSHSSISHGAVIVVPDSDSTKLRISNLIVVGRAQKSSPADPEAFKVGELMLYPNLGQALHKTTGKQLSMFLSIYLPKGATTAPKMSIELYAGGASAGQLPIELPAPDPSGRIQYTARIPLDAFPPGEYELKAMVTDGVTKAMRFEHFSVQP